MNLDLKRDRRNGPLLDRVFSVENIPCPGCGNSSVIGYLLLDEKLGHHQHTHYVCTAWVDVDRPRLLQGGQGRPCGWSGFSVR